MTGAGLALGLALFVGQGPLPAYARSAGHGHGAPAAPKLTRDVRAGIDTLTPNPPEQSDTTVEPSIAVNPSDPKNAVACYQVGRVDGGGDQTNGCATTFNGGKTWTQTYLPGLTPDTGGPFDRASDAAVAFGPNDVVYANSLVFDDGSESGDTNRSGVVVNVSTDGGRTWGPPLTVIDDMIGGLNDKNWITVDDSDAPGHHLGRVYVTWDRIAPVLASYSDDQGKTWNGPFVIDPGQGIGTIPVVMPSGDLAVVYAATSPAGGGEPGIATDNPKEPSVSIEKLVVSVATGAGALPTGAPLVFGPPLSASDVQTNTVMQQRAGEGLPSAGVDPKSGRLFVGWEDGRFRSDGANDAVVVWSGDEGMTWSPVTRVNPGPTGDHVDRWCTSIAVGADGTVHVMYRQRHEVSTAGDFWDVDTYVQESTDGGATFTAPLRVNRVRTDIRFGAVSRGGTFLGDYDQLAVGGGLTYVVRAEAFSVVPGEPATFPPTVHHQRTYVAVVKG